MRAASPKPGDNPWESLVGGAMGGLLGLALLKFGNPVILDWKIVAPKNSLELCLLPWPVAWGYGLLTLVALFSTILWRRQHFRPKAALALPLLWLGWQGLSALTTVDATLTRATLMHFASCVVCLYIGAFALSRVERMVLFWLGLVAGFAVVIVMGWQQHFGGLEETRRYFYQLPDWRDYSPEFIKKMSSNRIYSTLFYPNTLAGAILLLLPPALAVIWERSWQWPTPLRMGTMALPAFGALSCLYWSASKAGWLIMLAMGLAAFVRLPIRPAARWGIILAVSSCGMAGFFWKYSSYFERGATSVSARLDYWQAAITMAREHPLLGSGPGTFQVGYKRLKSPEAEMSRLTHNDYLEQAAESGVPGFALYLALIGIPLTLLHRRRRPDAGGVRFAIGLGLAGLAAQAVVEFPLYVPALAWPMFTFLGWLWGVHDTSPDKVSDF